MRLAKFIIIVLILPSVILHAQGAKSLTQLLENWPAGCDTTGKHWVVYNINKPKTHYVTDTSVASVTETTIWMAQIGNFNGGVNPWLPGDTLVTIGSIDTAYIHNQGTYGDNIDHTGFYWLFSDTIHSTPEVWLPSDTVRVIPKPIVTQTGQGAGADDTIWVKIPNPMETDTLDPIDYSVLGYWLVADSTGAGTPNALNDDLKVLEIGFIPVQGDTGDTTVFWMLESDMFLAWTHWTTYFAYKIIVRPDTTADNMGYSTYYWSQNSDAIDVYQTVIAVEENQNIGFDVNTMEVLPNPSRGAFNVKFDVSGTGYATLRLYDVLGCDIGLLWQGDVKNGSNIIDVHGQSKGIYFLILESNELEVKQKIVID